MSLLSAEAIVVTERDRSISLAALFTHRRWESCSATHPHSSQDMEDRNPL